MSNMQREKIIFLRTQGESYARIAHALGISENTVKSFCRRKNLGGIGALLTKPVGTACRNCGKPVSQSPGLKKRLFCSDACRVLWWNTHPEMVNRKAVYHFVCAHCGRQFQSYGNKGRRFCSHSCYIASRFGAKEAGATP